MKALTYYSYGGPEVLQIEEVPKPQPKNHEVLIKVKAASINSRDWDMLTGRPGIYRLLFGWPKPKYPVMGTDIAGVVQVVGEAITTFKPGDEVYGANPDGGYGAFAEYIVLPEDKFCVKPEEMSMREAAAIPEAGLLAFQSLLYGPVITSGSKVLINGAGGGSGTYAIQMAKEKGAFVTAVDSLGKHALLKKIGADEVIDYHTTDFDTLEDKYDLIIDYVATRSFFKIRRMIKPNGSYVVVGGKVGHIIKLLLWNMIMPGSKNRRIGVLAYKMNVEQLNVINRLYQQGKVIPVIDRVFSLSDGSEAMHYFNKGDFKGKIVIEV